MTAPTFYRFSLLLPLIVFPILLLLDALDTNKGRPLLDLEWKAWRELLFFTGLWLGLLPYSLFCFTLGRRIANEGAEEIRRLLLWAPLNFIPYYIAAWILTGLIGLVINAQEILSFFVGWFPMFLYIFPVGYFFIFLSFGLFELFRALHWISESVPEPEQ